MNLFFSNKKEKRNNKEFSIEIETQTLCSEAFQTNPPTQTSDSSENFSELSDSPISLLDFADQYLFESEFFEFFNGLGSPSQFEPSTPPLETGIDIQKPSTPPRTACFIPKCEEPNLSINPEQRMSSHQYWGTAIKDTQGQIYKFETGTQVTSVQEYEAATTFIEYNLETEIKASNACAITLPSWKALFKTNRPTSRKDKSIRLILSYNGKELCTDWFTINCPGKTKSYPSHTRKKYFNDSLERYYDTPTTQVFSQNESEPKTQVNEMVEEDDTPGIFFSILKPLLARKPFLTYQSIKDFTEPLIQLKDRLFNTGVIPSEARNQFWFFGDTLLDENCSLNTYSIPNRACIIIRLYKIDFDSNLEYISNCIRDYTQEELENLIEGLGLAEERRNLVDDLNKELLRKKCTESQPQLMHFRLYKNKF